MDLFSSIAVKLIPVIILCISLSECGRLNDYILDYQPLIYDRLAVHRNHHRVRRSVDTHLNIRLSAYGRDLQLQLSPSQGVFSADHQVFTDGVGLHKVDTSFIYQGHVRGEEERSWVHLSVHNGSLEGHVEMPETTYHIEPAAKYLKNRNPALHTIIYPETHLNTDPYRERRQEAANQCGVDHFAVQDFMEKASRLENEPKANVHARSTWADDHDGQSHNIYSEYSNRQKRSTHESNARRKRSLGKKNACAVHLRADPLLFNFFKMEKHGHNISNAQAEEEILAFFSSHVSAMSRIYSRTVFQTYDGQLQNTGLSFVIHRSTVMNTCNDRSRSYCTNTLDVSNYLDLTSEENHNLYCLVFTFTYRDFSGGTLGLAWVATLANTQSGVCGQYETYTGGKKKSLNTGIVTIINFGRTVPNPVSQLTFAHEAGHNFGSPHDVGSTECAPFGSNQPDARDGNYIMFPSATSGNKPNNDKFSPCSRDNITRVINQVLQGTARKMCFVESGQAFCGNKITEGSEKCDCGFGTCAQETCCVGRDPNVENSGCTLAPLVTCSPDSGPCCQSNCSYVPLAAHLTCADSNDCKREANTGPWRPSFGYCPLTAPTGNTYKCPDQVHKPNGTFCNSYSKVCMSGECIGPVCLNIKNTRGAWEECFQTSENGDSDSLCFVACKNPSTKDCISSKDSDALSKNENAPFKTMLASAAGGSSSANNKLEITLPAGSACDNFRGYCDTFSKCQRIDAQGPFNQLTNMIFNPVNLTRIKEWIEEHWWAVLLIALGVAVFMGIFIKIFSYNTPSEDPKQKRAREQHQKNVRRTGGGRETGLEMDRPPPYTRDAR
ncbi:hypothetical protein ACOMHN_062375 [Nucella lapillus]